MPLPAGQLILVIDALWLTFNRDTEYTLYVMALRSTEGDTATFLPPILLKGHESARDWRQVISGISENESERICALVSDGFRSVECIAKEHGWVFQSCLFHLFASLRDMRGNRRRLKFAKGRMRDVELIRELVLEPDDNKFPELMEEALALARDPDCPRHLMWRLHDVVRHLDHYRAYRFYPELNLPSTTNVIENMNSRIRGRLGRMRGLRTPASLYRWVHAYIRLHPNAKCRPKIPPN